MKLLKITALILFAAIIITPLCCFNLETDSVSAIDNRMLTENPFNLEGDLTNNIQSYINDRIGFRDEMITAYTVLNDRMFGKMVHPSYCYGKDGFVFGAGITTYNGFSDYHVVFADMVSEIQTYCADRNVPFLFVFNPAKPAVYQDKIADGVNYNREWVDLFFAELDKRNVNYLDNTQTLVKLRENGIDGFNQKFDANHWNDLGAFYGTKAMLEQMAQVCDNIHVNELDEFTVLQKQETSLLVSKFPINEYVPSISLNISKSSLYQDYFPEIEINDSYQGFGYYVNNSDRVKETPSVLVFQGSYMNSYGCKYMINAFEKYVHIHDYQNVLNFPYYYNIFQPECVIFEVAEYTFSNAFFNYDNMKNIDYNPPLTSLEKDMYKAVHYEKDDISVEKGKTLTEILWHTEEAYQYVWIEIDGNYYDMQKTDGGYRVTIETKRYESSKDLLKIYGSVSW